MRFDAMEDLPPMSAVAAPVAKLQTTTKRSRWLLPVCLCAVLIAGYTAFRLRPANKSDVATKTIDAKPAKGIPVVVATARQGDLPIYLDGLGTVTAFNVSTVRARVDGLLAAVNFVEGQIVKEGDLLAEIDSRPSQADLDSKIALEGQASAQVDLARITYDHLKKLIPENSASPIEYLQSVANLKEAEAALAGATANVASARLNFGWCHITAPISGRIGLRLVDKGNLVHANDPNGLAVITQVQPIAVLFGLQEDSLQRVLSANSVAQPLVAEAYDSSLKKLLATGSLQAVDNQIDSGTGTARFKAVFENRDNSLFPNQFVNIRLLIDTKHDSTLIPTAAVQRSPKSVFVYIVKSDETVELRPVELGSTERGETLVQKGVEPGETVVTDGVDKLQPGTKVNVRGADTRQARDGG